MPLRFILGLFLFNIFFTDLQEELKNSDIYSFADENTISVVTKNRHIKT